MVYPKCSEIYKSRVIMLCSVVYLNSLYYKESRNIGIIFLRDRMNGWMVDERRMEANEEYKMETET